MKCFQISTFVVIVIGVAATSCSNDSSPAPAPTSVPSPSPSGRPLSPEDVATQAALQVYEQYWQLSERAEAAPRSRDWKPELAKFMVDPALTPYVNDLQNLASVPAHSVGEYQRAPKVTSVSLVAPPRVIVTDCLDTTEEHLVSDKAGEEGSNLDSPGQPKRYEVEVQLVLYPNPDRWLIQQVQPRLEKTC